VFNAGKAHIWGIEFDGSVRPASFLRFGLAGAYLKSKLDSLHVDITPYLTNFDNILFPAAVGDPLPLTPKFGGNASATVTLPVPEDLGKIEFSALYRYSSKFSTAASNTNDAFNAREVAAGRSAIPVDDASVVKQVDLNLDWRDIGGAPIDLSFFASNVTDQTTYTLIQPLYASFGFDLRYIGQPRMYGMRLKVRFGETD
jgi:iron complex outermembrane receptor protein